MIRPSPEHPTVKISCLQRQIVTTEQQGVLLHDNTLLMIGKTYKIYEIEIKNEMKNRLSPLNSPYQACF